MSVLSRLRRLFGKRTIVVDAHELEALQRENAEAGITTATIDQSDPAYTAMKLTNNAGAGTVVGANYGHEIARVREAAKAADVINAQKDRD